MESYYNNFLEEYCKCLLDFHQEEWTPYSFFALQFIYSYGSYDCFSKILEDTAEFFETTQHLLEYITITELAQTFVYCQHGFTYFVDLDIDSKNALIDYAAGFGETKIT